MNSSGAWLLAFPRLPESSRALQSFPLCSPSLGSYLYVLIPLPSLFAHKLSFTVLDRCPQGKQIIDGRFLHRYHVLYCLTLRHVWFGCFPPYFLGLAIFPLPYNRELVRSYYFPWSEHLVSHAVRSGSCLSTYVVIIRDIDQGD